MMLDIAGLPKNMNGFRTTHTCELCGFEPKTKNKYREKQDHLVMKHFKEKIDKIFPHCRPYECPMEECTFTGKDKQALLRHYTGKHGILEKYLREALAEKGITYTPGENGKRRHSDAGQRNGHKNPRLSLTPPGSVQPVQTALEQITDNLKPVPIARPNTEELRKEVEAMMRSFQPVEQPVVLSIPSSALTTTVNGSSNSPSAVVTAIPLIESTTNGGNAVLSTATSTATVVPVASLPAIVLSAVANATAASVAANANGLNGNVSNGLSNGVVNGVVNGVNVSVSLPTQPANVPTITVSNNGSPSSLSSCSTPPPPPVIINPQKMASTIGPSPCALPLPPEVIAHSLVNGIVKTSAPVTNGDIVKSTTVTTNGHHVNGGTTSPSPMVVENEDVMWSAASTNGPAVVVEAAHTVPVTYIENVDATFATTTNLESIDYEDLYTATTSAPTEVRERQLDFSML